MTTGRPVGLRASGPRVGARLAVLGTVLGSVLAVTAVAAVAAPTVHVAGTRSVAERGMWPSSGQAAYVLGSGGVHASPHQRVAPIASVAKVMTAYLVLTAHPLGHGDGIRMTVTRADVADTARRARQDQSIVPVRAGEHLTERQALAAVLLPSANNIAIMLARRSAGSVAAFVRGMNSAAHAFGMRHTTYTDPSGFDATTRSTPTDQLKLALVAMRNASLVAMIAHTRYRLPVAGTVYNTDALLGSDGFIGIKTGSDDAAGGCFMFRSRRVAGGGRLRHGTVETAPSFGPVLPRAPIRR